MQQKTAREIVFLYSILVIMLFLMVLPLYIYGIAEYALDSGQTRFVTLGLVFLVAALVLIMPLVKMRHLLVIQAASGVICFAAAYYLSLLGYALVRGDVIAGAVFVGGPVTYFVIILSFSVLFFVGEGFFLWSEDVKALFAKPEDATRGVGA